MKQRKVSLSPESKRQLIALGLAAGVSIIEETLNLPDREEMAAEDLIEMIISRLYQNQHNDKIKRLKRTAKLRYPTAEISCIDYSEGRNLERRKIIELATCDYMITKTNLALYGPTGCGKTYLACALANSACTREYRSCYVRFPDLIESFEEHSEDIVGVRKLIRKLAKFSLLVIDEWLLTDLKSCHQDFLLDLIEFRHTDTSTVFCSQYNPSEWHERLGGGTKADSILDRIVHNMKRIEFGSKNMREVIAKRY